MLYVRQITTSAGTAKANALTTRVKVWAGAITRIEVRFPPGPQFLLHCTVSIGGKQIFPVDDSYDIVGDDENVRSQEFVEMQSGWNQLIIRTWNDDTINAHDCIVRVTVLPLFIADPFHAMADMTLSLRLLLKRLGVIK